MNKKLTLKNANIAIKNGKIVIEFDEKDLIEETSDICTSNNNRVELSELNPGDEFLIGSSVYVVVDHIDGETKVISKEIAHEMPFDRNKINNYLISDVRNMVISQDYNHIADCVGKHNIVTTLCDTTALNGNKGYGALEDSIAILSFDEYRKYRDVLTNIQGFTDTPQWLLTPFATCRDMLPLGCTIDKYGIVDDRCSDALVCIIDKYGIVDDRCSDANAGVRPFFTLKSSTEVKPYKPMAYDDNDETD